MKSLPKPIKSKNPVVILRHVVKLIQEEPKRYNQLFYRSEQGKDGGEATADYPACGTICCVAGWVNTVTGKQSYPDNEWERAENTLGLDPDESLELFRSEPDDVRPRDQVGAQKHAADGIKHIKRFVLKKWGKKL